MKGVCPLFLFGFLSTPLEAASTLAEQRHARGRPQAELATSDKGEGAAIPDNIRREQHSWLQRHVLAVSSYRGSGKPSTYTEHWFLNRQARDCHLARCQNRARYSSDSQKCYL